MCGSKPKKPKENEAAQPPPRLVDRAVVQAKLEAKSRLSRGGHRGNLTGTSEGVLEPAAVIRRSLIAANQASSA